MTIVQSCVAVFKSTDKSIQFTNCVHAAAHSYNAAAIRRPICRRFGTEPEPTGSGPNQIQY